MINDPHVAATPRLLVISHDVVGAHMAGPGIRYWELARVLGAQQPTTLIAPQPIDAPPSGFTCGRYVWGNATTILPWLANADVVFANGFVLQAHPELAQIGQPLALDLYDPVPLENLELFRTAPADQRTTQAAQDVALLAQQLRAGDFFACATERQRDLYLGALLHAGRITVANTDHDPELRGLVDVVPFGVPSTAPAKRQPALRGVVPGIGDDDFVLLWTGGLWDWLDPLTLIQAMPEIIARCPQARLVFLAGQHPGAIQPMRMPQIARERAGALHLLDSHIFFHEQWVPYRERANYLLEADLAISLHRNHLETAYAAVRSRFLDHLWAGLPSVVSDGDAAAELVRQHKLGGVVPTEDVRAVAAGIVELLQDVERRAACAERAKRLGQTMRWEDTAVALLRFCANPTRTRPSPVPTAPWVELMAPAPPAVMEVKIDMQSQSQPLIQQLERLWQIESPPPSRNPIVTLLQRVVLRLLAPLLAQQREFNANVVKLSYALQTQDADMVAYLEATLAQTVAVQNAIHLLQVQLRDLQAHTNVQTEDLHGRLNTLAEFDGRIQAFVEARTEALAEFDGRIQAFAETLQHDLHGRIDSLAEFDGRIQAFAETLERDLHARADLLATFDAQINDRVERLRYGVQLLNDAVATADEAAGDLATHIANIELRLNTAGNGANDHG